MRPLNASGSIISLALGDGPFSGTPAPVGSWNRQSGIVPEFSLEVYADGACVADVTVFALVQRTLGQFEPIELMVNGDKLVAKSAHRLRTGDGPFYAATGSTAADAVPQWVRRVDDKSLRLASTLDAALVGDVQMPVEAARRGSATLVATCAFAPGAPARTGVNDTPQRIAAVRHEHLGELELGPLGGALKILRHAPQICAYALAGKVAASSKGEPPNVLGRICALQER